MVKALLGISIVRNPLQFGPGKYFGKWQFTYFFILSLFPNAYKIYVQSCMKIYLDKEIPILASYYTNTQKHGGQA